MFESLQGQELIARTVEKTLAEQLQVTEREISTRKAMLGFTREDEECLMRLQGIVAANVDEIVIRFYQTQLNYPEISLLIGDSDTLQRLKSAMRSYVIELFEGSYGTEYVNKRLRIGKVHKRIGLEPKLYVSAIHLLQSNLETVLMPQILKNDTLGEWELLYHAVRKLLMFDMQLVFDTYIMSLVAEVEVAKSELEDYASGLEKVVSDRTKQLQELSLRDSLTGLYNHRAFVEELDRELAVAKRTGTPLCLAYLDLNGFKKLNDKKGHQQGDKLLEMVGSAIKAAVREVDIGCRCGGDEFCIIMPRTELVHAYMVCERLISTFESSAGSDVTFSIGVMQTGPEEFLDSETFISAADALMYQAKSKSKQQDGHYIEPVQKAA